MATGSWPGTMGRVSTPTWRAEDGELLHGGGAAGVERGHEHALALALLEAAGELGGGGGLAGALQADHEDRARAGESMRRWPGSPSPRSMSIERVVDDLDDLLAGGDGLGDGLALGLVGDGLDEVAGDGERDVGFEQRGADLAQRGGDVLVGEGALAGERAEDAGEPVGKGLEHGPPPSFKRRSRRWAQRADRRRSWKIRTGGFGTLRELARDLGEKAGRVNPGSGARVPRVGAVSACEGSGH